MRAYQTILLVVIVLAVNNAVFFNLPRFFTMDDPATGHLVRQEEQSIKSRLAPVRSYTSRSASKKPHTVFAESEGQDQLTQSDGYDQDLIQELGLEPAFDKFLSSDKFTQALDRHQSEVGRRSEKIFDRLSKLSAQDLLSVAMGKSYPFVPQMAQKLVFERDLNEYSVQDFKSLYLAEGTSEWFKRKALVQLLDRDESQALNWAKQKIKNPAGHETIGTPLYTAVYESDPKFITQHFSNLDLNDFKKSSPALSLVANDMELSKSFYEENFDRIIDIENSQIFTRMRNIVYLELSSKQQSRVPELFASKSRSRRRFGINIARSVNDVNVLRESYSRLNENSEKLALLNILKRKAKRDSAINSLVRELASGPDD